MKFFRIILFQALLALSLFGTASAECPIQGCGTSGSGVVTSSESGNLAILNDAFSGKNLTHVADFTDTTGTAVGLDTVITTLPGGASSAINVGARGKIVKGDDSAETGHSVGVLCGYDNTTTGTVPLAIGCEGKLEQTAAGIITTAVGSENQVSANVSGATITSFIGNNNTITSNAGTITTFTGNMVQVSGNTGSVTNVVGGLIVDLQEGSGNIDSIIGLQYNAQPSNTAATKIAVLNNDTGAKGLDDRGTTQSTGVDSGSVTLDGGMGMNGNAAFGGFTMFPENSARADAGAVPLTEANVFVSTTTASAISLAAGTQGQEIFIVFVTDTGDATMSVTGFGFSQIVFNDVGDTVKLRYLSGFWALVSEYGVVIT